MSNIRFIFLLLMVCCLQRANAAHITGVLINAQPGEHVKLIVPQEYVNGQSETHLVVLDKQLTFSIAAKVPEPQVVFLMYQYNRLPIFIEPDDTLEFRVDVSRFTPPFEFIGRGAVNNHILQQYYKENPPDYDEMNNFRLKIGPWWASIEPEMYEWMERLNPTRFKSLLDMRKTAFTTLLDDFIDQSPTPPTPAFLEWASAEITYSWAYHLLLYGHAYANRYPVPADFFDFLYEAPNFSNAIGSAWYRQFLQALVCRHWEKEEQTINSYVGRYVLAEEMLYGKPLAFIRSEMIRLAFEGEQYREILPVYAHFTKTNEFPAFETKVADLYEKAVRASPGAPGPLFTARDSKGTTVSLAQLRGRVVYLNFWASWCKACLEKMDIFDYYAADFNRLGIEIVNVSIDENPAKWLSALAERKFEGRNILASSGKEGNIANSYGVEAVPQYFIIDKSGAFAGKPAVNKPEAIKNQLINLAQSY